MDPVCIYVCVYVCYILYYILPVSTFAVYNLYICLLCSNDMKFMTVHSDAPNYINAEVHPGVFARATSGMTNHAMTSVVQRRIKQGAVMPAPERIYTLHPKTLF